MQFPDYTPPVTGIALPVSSLRSAASCGIGEFSDLPLLGSWCAETNIDLVQILPVNDTGFETSPYSAVSAYALHPVYIRLSGLPGSDQIRNEIELMREEFETAPQVRFFEVAKRKMDLLSSLFEKTKSTIINDGQLQRWIDENPWIKPYSVYKTLKARNNEDTWENWPAYQQPSSEDIELLWKEHADETLFHCWVQYHLEGQLHRAAVQLEEMGIALKGDLPILMKVDSADVWYKRQYFDLELRAGAPPDMYSDHGQNWGFPIYDWDRLEKDGFSWWKRRLHQADKFYHAYRIDHVLGFFRIWAIPAYEDSGGMGFFKPSAYFSRDELKEAGFSDERIRWCVKPHIPGREITEKLGSEGAELARYLDQIGDEDMYLIKPEIRGSRDIAGLPISDAAKEALNEWNRNRMLIEIEPGVYSVGWNYRNSRAYNSLNEDEKAAFEALKENLDDRAEELWEKNGMRLLSFMEGATGMLVCAEDLGVVPTCVPKVLRALGILSLKICFWTRYYEKQGAPFVPISEYPPLSVTMLSAHDTPTIRQWWEQYSDEQTRREFSAALGLEYAGDDPESENGVYTPELAEQIVRAVRTTSSQLCIYQIQELFAMEERYRYDDPLLERINVPGTLNETNWTYRLPFPIEQITDDKKFSALVRSVMGT